MPNFYQNARVTTKNSFGKTKPENMTAEDFSRKYGLSENRPRVSCPGCGFDGKNCNAELHLSSNNGTAYFAANDREDHSLGCRYALSGGRRIQPIPEMCLPFDITDFGKSKAKKGKDGLSTENGTSLLPNAAPSSDGMSEGTLDDMAMEGGPGLYDDKDNVYGIGEGNGNRKERLVLERPRTFPDIVKTMLSSEACKATKDGHMIEDQLFCRRTAEYFLDPYFKLEQGDCIVFIGEKCPGLSKDLTREMNLKNTILFRNPYDRDLSTLFAVVCSDKEVYASLLKLIKKKDDMDYMRFVLGLSFLEKRRHRFQGEMREIRFFRLNDIKYATVMTEYMENLDREID